MAYVIGRTLFLHIPKTGGKAVLSALREAGNRVRPVRSPGWHNGHAGVDALADPRYNWDFVFAFVRHPVSWWKSLHDFASTPGTLLFDYDRDLRHPFNDIIADAEELRHAGAETFVREMATVRWRGFYSRMLRRYLGDDFGSACWIGRQETLAVDLRSLCERRGLAVPDLVPDVNVSQPASKSFLSCSTMIGVEAFEADAMNEFYGDRGTTVNAQGATR
jgi:hypothetical protein